MFKELLDGDYRKFEARSNDAGTGGGARDLRFNFEAFEPQFAEMFPGRREVVRRRGGVDKAVEVFVGQLFHPEVTLDEDGIEVSHDILFEPPTDARSGEGRIPRIHECPPFLDRLPGPAERPAFLLLIQDTGGVIRPYYAPVSALGGTDWNEVIARFLLDCRRHTPRNRAAQGYMDFVCRRKFCNG